jgi:diamine N-acetyltransferase
MKRPLAPIGAGRVRLRLIEAADLPTTLAWRNRDEVRVWFKTSVLLTPEQHQGWFERYRERDDDFLFVVEAEGQPVGQVSVYGIDWQSGQAEVGRFLAAPQASGQGYMRDACAALFAFCRDGFGLRYLFLEVLADNARAIELYRHQGFIEEQRYDGLVRMGLRFG